MGKKHAKLSPSGGKKWLTCTPSATLEAKLPDKSTSYADEGTFAHWLSLDVILPYRLGKITEVEYDVEIKVAKSRSYYSLSLHEYCKDFASYVIEQYNRCRAIDPHAVILLEHELDMSMFIPEGFGTADVIIVCDGLLIMIDLKMGQGVPVAAEENEQLKIYALGAIERLQPLYNVSIVELHIYQPRIDNTSSWTTSIFALYAWANDVLIPGAEAAHTGKGEFVPGDHCRFCRVRLHCAALTEYVLTSYEPGQIPGTISAEKVSEVLLKEDLIKSWLNAITEWALKEAVERGRKWPGFKVVEGISRRYISDETAAIKILQDLKYSKSEYTETSLLALGKLEELVGGKKKFTSLFENVLGKPKGKPTLVPVSDKRHELNNLEDAFADIDI